MLGCINNLELFQERSGSFRWKYLVQRSACMSIEIIHDEGDTLCICIVFLHQAAYAFSPFTGGVVIGHLNPSPIVKGGVKQHQVCNTVALIFAIITLRLSRPGGNRCPGFPDALHTGFVHTHDRIPGVMGSFVDFQHFFHLTDEMGVTFCRYAPHLLLPGFDGVFLKPGGHLHD